MTDESYKNKGIINGFNKCLTIGIRSEISRSGWNPTGPKTSRSFSGLRGGIHS